MKYNLLSRILLVTAVAAFGGTAFMSCDKMPGDDGMEYLEDDYLPVTEFIDDWSGDYVVAHVIDTKSVEPFAALEGSEGKPGKALKIHTGGVLWGSSADDAKTVLKKADEYSYIMHVAGVGYIGYDGKSGFVRSYTESTDDAYLWDVLLSESGTGYVQLSPKTADETNAIVWDGEKGSFIVGTTDTPAILFRRLESAGIKNNPAPPDGSDDDGKDDGKDDGDNDNPNPSPKPVNAKYGWFELPVTNYEESGKYLISKDDNTLYYAHHLCAGGEKGPNGKTARNYTTCYSSKYHCPVWVAAPKHSMYEGSIGRQSSYSPDPDIPSDIQVCKWTGYTRGHMLGSSDRQSSTQTRNQVYYYSNIAPQVQANFNTGGGAWNNLEDYFVDYQVCSDTLYAVIGCYFDKFTDKYGKTTEPATIAKGTAYPTMFYYVLLRTKNGNTRKSVAQCSANELKCAAFVLRHTMEKGHKVQAQDMMTVEELEKLTGFTYFPNVPNAPKNVAKASDWGL